MKLLVDNNLPPRLGSGLGALFDGEHIVQHIKQKFGTGSLPDEEWIELLGREGGWCVLSGDRNIAKRKPSRALFMRSNLVGFFPQPAVMKMPLHAQAARILTVWPAMVATDLATSAGCYEIGVKTGQLRQMV
ncbi:hypothetical protein [Sphingomonas sp. IW22]|uniref:PIN-like domain-containing protein n=1 Tax=Sphingomonas sp. IW22 TaxID=3242489 RepID=UPI00352168A9